MNPTVLFNFDVDKENRKIKVQRSFEAPLGLVWSAWTDSEILDQWWAPRPWKSETKEMKFEEGGRWLYAMVGPDGDRHNCLFEYETIVPQQSFAGLDAFCDENWEVAMTKPRVFWANSFSGDSNRTVVTADLSFDSLADLEAILEMGFKEGFTMGMGNLDEWLAENK